MNETNRIRVSGVAGPELDAAVAEHVMGYVRLHRVGDPNCAWLFSPNSKQSCLDGVPQREWIVGPFEPELTDRPLRMAHRVPFSTDIAAAWQVVESLGMWVMPAENGHGWRAGVSSLEDPPPDENPGSYASEAPLAICIAALRSKGIEVIE